MKTENETGPSSITDDPWSGLLRYTTARIARGRVGSSLPTREVLEFGLAHAQARDAVHTRFDVETVEAPIGALGWPVIRVASAAADRGIYLRRPDLGRRLSAESREALSSAAGKGADIAIIVGDGLSSTAIHANIRPFLEVFKPFLDKAGYSLAPIVMATNTRVALGDEAGELLGVKAAIMLIGERPGLSSPDSLGAYLTFAPKVGRNDAERNCISNIRPDGLPYPQAAYKLSWLLAQSFRLQMTGVNLKDNSTNEITDAAGPLIAG